MLRTVRASLFVIIALCIAVLLPPSANAVDPNPDVDKGTKPGDWISAVVGANKDKWDIQGKVPLTEVVIPFSGLSPGMLKILLKGSEQGADWNPPGVCNAAAVNQGWSGLNNSTAGGAGLVVILQGKDLILSIMGAQKIPSMVGQAEKIEEKIKDWIKKKEEDKIKDYLKGKGVKPEVYISRALFGDCSLATLAIWDKAAGTYEIIVYGDCDCKQVRVFMSYQQTKLKTFALRLTGTVSLKLEGDDIAFEARSGARAVHANCKCTQPGQPEPKEPPGKAPEPPVDKPAPPIPAEDVTTNCKECQSIVDKIKTAHAERKEIMRTAQDAQDKYLGAVNAGLKKEAAEFELQVAQLGNKRRQVERTLRDLGGQLAECEKEKCGPKAPGAGAEPQKTGPQEGCPPCEPIEDQIKKIDAEIQKKNGERDNAIRIVDKEGPDSEKGTKAIKDRDRLQQEIEELSKEANKLQEELKKCTEKNCPPRTPSPSPTVAKDDCDGLKEKIRTLQDSLRKLQAEPASPKEDLETIRRQIDELLNKLADCPKQEPIDEQFDCLKSKFPELQRSPDKKDTAFDPTSQRSFAWDNDKQAWTDKDTKESICPPSGIDSCLVGTWECTSFKIDAPGFTGGTGFRVTFKSDGTETVDYSSMQPTRAASRDMDKFSGKASAKISTDKGVAKIEEGKQTADLGLSLVQIFGHGSAKCPGLGPGGLGSSKDNNSYKCTEDSLEYQTTWLGVVYGGHHRQSYTVKLKKVKP